MKVFHEHRYCIVFSTTMEDEDMFLPAAKLAGP